MFAKKKKEKSKNFNGEISPKTNWPDVFRPTCVDMRCAVLSSSLQLYSGILFMLLSSEIPRGVPECLNRKRERNKEEETGQGNNQKGEISKVIVDMARETRILTL